MLNKWIGIGHLTDDVKKLSSTDAITMAKFTLAIQKKYTNKDGTKETDFVNCVAFRTVADNLVKYCHKGDKIGVEGYIQTRTYDGQDGQKKYLTEVVVENCEFLNTKKTDEPKEDTPPNAIKVDDSTLPF